MMFGTSLQILSPVLQIVEKIKFPKEFPEHQKIAPPQNRDSSTFGLSNFGCWNPNIQVKSGISRYILGQHAGKVSDSYLLSQQCFCQISRIVYILHPKFYQFPPQS